MWGDKETQYFYQLSPETILNAIDVLGLKTTGRCLPLNSMENRVYEIEVDKDEDEIESISETFVIAKFYRPGRWTKDQILEEHEFLLDLQKEEIPVIAPIEINGETLFTLKEHDIFYTLFPKKGGRAPEEMNSEQLEQMGRLLARMHNVGASKKAKHRITLEVETYGEQNLKYLLDNKFIPPHLEASYKEVAEEIFTLSKPLFENVSTSRIHGDCHWGNVIWRENEGPFFIDFDDMVIGPAIQDIWLVAPGSDKYAVQDRNSIIEGYESMRDFDYTSLKLIEPLRTLRYIHFSAWIAKRWEDPAFKNAFSHFDSPHYWDSQLNDLRVQLQAIKNVINPPDYYY